MKIYILVKGETYEHFYNFLVTPDQIKALDSFDKLLPTLKDPKINEKPEDHCHNNSVVICEAKEVNNKYGPFLRLEEWETDTSCEVCGTDEDVEYGPDPYASDMYDDQTSFYMCSECRRQAALEI